MKVVNVKVNGIAPLLQHRYPEESEDTKSTKKTGRIDYSTEVTKNAFMNEAGVFYEPSSHIEGALRTAATNFQITGRGKKTYKDLVLSSIVVDPKEIPLTPQKYEVDKQSVKVNQARVSRYRPRWDKWELGFKINILDEQFSPEVLKEILEYAGSAKGIGDYRPKYGRFKVTEFEVEDEE